MKTLGTCDHFILVGSIPDNLRDVLVEAISTVSLDIFFDSSGQPRKNEIKELDQAIADSLKKLGWISKKNFCPFLNSGFEVDLAIEEQKLLIEIEKGKQPRLELDIIKIASACCQFPDKWQLGALIVPSSYINLKLAGESTPFEYLNRLVPIVKPLVAPIVKGFLIIGYNDPRASYK